MQQMKERFLRGDDSAFFDYSAIDSTSARLCRPFSDMPASDAVAFQPRFPQRAPSTGRVDCDVTTRNHARPPRLIAAQTTNDWTTLSRWTETRRKRTSTATMGISRPSPSCPPARTADSARTARPSVAMAAVGLLLHDGCLVATAAQDDAGHAGAS